MLLAALVLAIPGWAQWADDEIEDELEQDEEELELMEEEELEELKSKTKEHMLKDRKQRYENFY